MEEDFISLSCGISTPVVMSRLGGKKWVIDTPSNMFVVYILQNSNNNRHYIGSTNNLGRRIEEHNRGQTKSTRQNGVWKVIYVEEYDTALQAKRREKIIKSYKGGNAFKKLIAS